MSTATATYLGAHDRAQTALVLVLEGVDLILTTSDDVANIASSFGSGDWGTFKNGLRRDGLVLDQSIEVFKASVHPSNLTLTVVDVDGTLDSVFQSDALATAHQTELTQDFLPTDTTCHVLDATQFPSSGTFYIGTRAYNYTNKTGTTFTGCSARFSMFTTSTGAAFRQLHRCDSTAGSDVAFRPTVSSTPLQWYGRQCALYLAVNIDGTWTDFGGSELLWAGRLRALHDDGTGTYQLDCESILSMLQGQLLADPYRGEASGLSTSGMTATELQLWSYTNKNGTVATNIRNLTLSNPTTHEELASEVGKGLAFSLGAGGAITYVDVGHSQKRYRITWKPGGISSQTAEANFTMHYLLWRLLGFRPSRGMDSAGDYLGVVAIHPFTEDGTGSVTADDPPSKFVMPAPVGTAAGTIALANSRGTWRSLPATAQAELAPAAPYGTQGFLKIGDSTYAVKNTATDTFAILADVTRSIYDYTSTTYAAPPSDSIVVPIDNGAQPIIAQQVWVELGRVSDVFRRLLVSTGTSGANDATNDPSGNAYDANPSSMGMAVPYSILDTDSLRALGSGRYALVVDKPTPFTDLLESILNLTATVLVWRSGKITVRPIGADAPAGETTVSLLESNKARPSDRTKVMRGLDGVINRVVIHFNRDNSGNFASDYTINNVSSQTDTGSVRTLEINALGIYDSLWGAAGSNLADYTSKLAGISSAYFARPAAQLARSYDASLLCSLYPGDRVAITDNNVVDPTTGTRGLTRRAAWVMSTRFDFATGIGDVVLVFTPEMTPSRMALWAPSLRVDETNSGGGITNGYDSTNHRLYVKTLAYSNPHGTVNDIAQLTVGDAIHIRSLGATAPTQWTRTISAINTGSNYIDLSAALSSPSFDTSLVYVIEPDTALNVTTTQLGAFTFQASTADNSTGKAPNDYYVYSPTLTTISTTGDSPPDYQVIYRRTPTADYSTGAPMSVHKWADAFYNALNLHGYVCSPAFVDVVTSGNQTTQTGVTHRLGYGPVALPLYDLSPLRSYKVRVYGSASGGTATFRVVLSTSPVQGSSVTSLSYTDGGGSFADVTTTSAQLAWTSQGTLVMPTITASASGPPIVWVTVEIFATVGNTATFGGIEIVEAPLTSGSWAGA